MTKNKNSVQGLICLERFTRFGVKTDKVEIVFFSVEPTNISVLSKHSQESNASISRSGMVLNNIIR